MSEQNWYDTISAIAIEQKKTKPKIEDVIPYYLDGNMKKTALDFVSYLHENKMKPVWASANAWKVSYKSKGVCYVRLHRGEIEKNNWNSKSWVIEPRIFNYDEYEEQIVNEKLQDIIWKNLYYCKFCHPAPCKIRNTKLLGKEVKGICGGRPPAWFWDPGEAEINCVKRLLEFEKNFIEKNKK